MNEPGLLNDKPIDHPGDDRFGIDEFSRGLARSLKNIESPIGTTIAVNGKWGAGKSSAVNLVRHYLGPDIDSGTMEIIDFNCWWFRGEDALTFAFFHELNAAIGKDFSRKTRELIPKLGKILLQAGSIAGPVVNLLTGGILGSLTSGSMDFAKRVFFKRESIQRIFEKLSQELEKQEKRFIVVIDDIDRLNPNEMMVVFRLVKSIGRLPNVIYLLAYDVEIAEKAAEGFFPMRGKDYLEKIVQAGFELPLPSRDDLNQWALKDITGICGEFEENENSLRTMNIFFDSVSPYINTPRDLTRFTNSIKITWPVVKGEVDPGDFIAVEAMRLFEPKLYLEIQRGKYELCSCFSRGKNESGIENILHKFTKDLLPESKKTARDSLMRLFPLLGGVCELNSTTEECDKNRLICSLKYFDSYFRLGTGVSVISKREIEGLIRNAGNEDFLKKEFLNASKKIDKSGRSKFELIVDEFFVHSNKIEKNDIHCLVKVLFEKTEEYFEAQFEGYLNFPIYLKIHKLVENLLLENFIINERTAVLLGSLSASGAGFLVDFLIFLENESQDLIKENDYTELNQLILETIEKEALDFKLLKKKNLPCILFKWADLAGDEKVKEWTGHVLRNDILTSDFAAGFTMVSWSQRIGLVGMDDRVAVRKVKAYTRGIEKIINPQEFKDALYRILDKKDFNDELKLVCKEFLESWKEEDEKGVY